MNSIWNNTNAISKISITPKRTWIRRQWLAFQNWFKHGEWKAPSQFVVGSKINLMGITQNEEQNE